ncbi:Striatin-interacting protein 1 homolog [Geodia barretti]|uniref:Striatin-interacting protein 1 homolog n=1 Tax=Geodia barretti TaxID=519541 RepID=A0AA35R1X2_GEOBA|nr:Striatin-interacting protein 1 homolog [Geodia barretti]
MSLVDGGGGATGTGRIDLRQVLRRQRKDSDPTPGDAPDLEFEYADTDTYAHELSELYSYSEAPEFYTTREVFETCLETSYDTSCWADLSREQQLSFVMSLLDRFEVVEPKERLEAVKCLLYLAHGNFAPDVREESLEPTARANIFMMLELGVYCATIELLAVEMEQGKGVYEGTRANITIADNYNLRMCLSLLYVIVETMQRGCPNDPPDWLRLRKSFIESLSEPVVGEETLTSLLFVMLLAFCNGTMPHYPIKRILLLIWKTILAMMGGLEDLQEIKKQRREVVGLPAEFPEVRPSRPLILPTPAFDPRGLIDGAAARINRGISQVSDTDSVGDISISGGKGLDFRPKARSKDVEAYVESCRSKYGCFETGEGGNELVGLPEPIQESIRVLQQHVYVPLSDIQIAEEETAKKAQACALPTGKPAAEDKTEDCGVTSLTKRDNPTESLYKVLLPNLPQYMIALLKVLLAAAPTSRARNDSLNILGDVLPPEAPTNIVETTQVTFDVNRHKEIIVKAISATLLLLLKHFKVNHIYQFEYMSQHLVFANCIPLVLKFFNQNMMQYISARNNFPSLNFPTCVLLPQDGEVTLEVSESTTTDSGFCWRNLFSCINLVRILQKLTKWKHFRTVMLVVFRSAPILKRALKVRHPMMQLYILKLLKVQTKYLGRNWRRSNMKTISAIYRRVRHHLHDDWAYGNDLDARPWDFQQQEFALKASIEYFNTTYYSPDPPSLTDPFGGKLSPMSQNYLSVLGKHVPLSKAWKEKYEEWVEVEVFQMPRDWDKFLESPTHYMEAKPMDL